VGNGPGAVGALIRESNATQAKSGNSTGSSSGIYVVEARVQGKTLKVNKFDYPVIVNSAVEMWLTYFQGKGRKFFEKYLERSRYFIPEISRELKKNNMPQDLVYLAMIESGFNNSARSRARAVGPWQFMKGTGQRYNLTVDYWIDERRDTRKSTLAAIHLLKELHDEFDSWELAAAGYNAGEGKVRRAISKYHTHDFWEIARHRFFKRETKDYVPKIMAAAILTKNAELFGFTNPFKKIKNSSTNPVVVVSDNTVEEAGEDKIALETELAEPTPKELGEEVKDDKTPDDPADKDTVESLADLDPDEADDEAADMAEDQSDKEGPAKVSDTRNPTMTPSLYMVANPNDKIMEFALKGPSDLFAIAKAADLPFSTIKTLNPELSRWCTPPTMKTYKIKLPVSVKEKFLSTYNDPSFDRRVVFLQYKVRHGDTVGGIARRFSTEADAIRKLNGLPPKSTSIRAGNTISLPLPTGNKRVIASMYDEKPLPPLRHRRHRRKSHPRSGSNATTQRERLQPNLVRLDSN
jgi:hypothetical protein